MSARTPGTAPVRGAPRAELIADTALALLAERGMRGLTHRAVDEAAGLPTGSTSNHARTRLALLEAAVRRQAEREAAVLAPDELPDPAGDRASLVDGLALTLHRFLTGEAHRALLVSRYELALEATRRPELRAYYDATGARFRDLLRGLLRAAGSTDPERHTLSLVAWCDGMLFACVAGSYSTEPPTRGELRAGLAELLGGLLDG
ncbi:TetR family transcriptional regulator C-terminal domain-containing protein [Streptomyces longispororuber]|uniref:TetR/AcrR family transcriptional regulator n=1 Tax=Streptomyces longispororuber TaxID=68230 RepID=UPI0033E567CB